MNYTDDNKQTNFERARTPENQDKDPGVQGIGIRRYFQIVTPAVEKIENSAVVVSGLETRTQLQAKQAVDSKYEEWLNSQAPGNEGPVDVETARRAIESVDLAKTESTPTPPLEAASKPSEQPTPQFFDPETSGHLNFDEIYRNINDARQGDSNHA
jgi:hypothetical protein